MDGSSTVYFLGDVYLPHAVEVADDIPGALIYNLEAPITQQSRGWPGTVNLRCGDDHSVATFGRSPIAVCLANNHIMDFGQPGLSDTLTTLSASHTAYFGVGSKANNCGNPLLLPVHGQVLGIMGYVCPTAHPVFASDGHPGVAPMELTAIYRDVMRARQLGATRIVVCLHLGIEEVELPRPEDVQLARKIAELPVDLVIGHHAHCIQPFEVHAGVPIFYGLGNAIFPNVNAWMNYSEDGHPGEPFRKRQYYWNKPSLAVAFDMDSGEVHVDRWSCDGRRLRIVERGVSSPRLPHTTMDEYRALFRRHHFHAIWRKKIVNYIHDPKLPRYRHLRSVLNILRESRATD